MQNVLNTMNRIGPLRLAAMAAMAVSLIVFFVFVSSRLTSGQMKLLYSDLSAQDKNAVVRELEAANITYVVSDGSGEIQVGAQEVGRARMLLAEKGLPEGGSVGYEIFDKDSGLGTTRFDQDMKQLRALEGELMRTVNTIKSVENSRIHLVLPKRELFSRETRPATASVFLKLRAGRKLDDEQVQAIQHLIAAAVPELNPKMVSIVDQAGNLLANGRDDNSEAAATGNVEKLRLAFEQKLMLQIQDMLTKVVGIGKVNVVVSADMDYDKETISAEKYDPEGQVARSTQTVEDNENESEAKQNNVSVQNNLPGLPDQGAGQGDSRKSNRTEEVTNFEVSKTVSNHIREGGQIKSLSVAVLVDGNYAKDKDGKEEYTPRDQKEIDNLKALVSSAIGYNEKRGDKIEVVNMRFAAGEEGPDASITDAIFMGMNKDDLFRLAETGLLGLVSILVVLLVLRPMASRLLSPREEAGNFMSNPDGTLMMDSEGKPMLAGPNASGTLMIEKSAMGGENGGEFNEDLMVNIAAVDGKIKASSIQKVNEIIDRYPNEAVSIVRSWMFQES
ncbi:MAG: fliF [Alphaproteobacteria bacterium]|nr:fliF [Alphaproteobacteria bacterium]